MHFFLNYRAYAWWPLHPDNGYLYYLDEEVIFLPTYILLTQLASVITFFDK